MAKLTDAQPTDAGVSEALRRAERKLTAYVGVCKGDKELTDTVLPMVRAALSTAIPAGDGVPIWQPIETAPKDKFILLSCEEDQSIWFAKWQGDVWHGIDEFGLTREGHSAGDPNFVTGWFVERWQPLPPLSTASTSVKG